MILIPDSIEIINGVKVCDYNLLEHNPNKVDMPSRARTRTVAITIHNTGWIKVAANTTPAEQYVRATYNGNMGTCRVNYYVDDTCAWRCMPDDWVNWSCADGCSNPSSGNNTSLAIEVIGDSKEAEENAIKLAAYLLNKYKLSINTGLRTHSYWLNIKAGKKGTIDALNTMKNNVKNCPIYILPHWAQFKDSVKDEMDKLNGVVKEEDKPKYIIKNGDDIKEFSTLEIAKQNCPVNGTVSFEGKVIYTNEPAREAKPQVDVYYRSFVNGRWLNEIKNCNDTTTLGYSGIVNRHINGLAAKVSKGKLAYRVHILNGGWLNWITQYNIKDWSKGVAGLRTQIIDGIQLSLTDLEGYKIEYRVSNYGTKNYLPWVEGTKDYAGIFGKPIDQIQIKIVGVD